MYKFMNLSYFMRKTGRITSRKSLFLVRPTWNLMAGKVKNDGHTIDMSKFPQRMKKQLLKVSAP